MIAYELREDYRGTVTQVLTVDAEGNPVDTREVPKYSGGVVTAGDGDLNIVEALEEGNGRIVLNEADPESTGLINVLDNYPALKRVAIDEDDKPAAGGLASMTYNDLRGVAKRLGLTVEQGTKVDELRKGLLAHATHVDADDSAYSPGEGRAVTIKSDGTLEVVSETPEA